MALSRPRWLPTVWSNCLAGYWLGGGGSGGTLAYLLLAATLLYFGGALLNDAFDVDHDRQHRRTRPIPSGAVSLTTVWRCGLGCLASGLLMLSWAGRASGTAGLVLVIFMVIFYAIHRLVAFAPVLLGICRFLLYLVSASMAQHGVTGWAIWCGLAMGAYVSGLGFFARWQKAPDQAHFGPVFLLAVPIGLAFVLNSGRFHSAGLLLSAIQGLWCVVALRQTFWSVDRQVDRTVTALVSGIVAVDWLAVADAPRGLSFLFLGLWGAAVLLQSTGTRPVQTT